ncbi:hypothetical protein BJ742DRAFT_874848, partial [Cladochytrium replicatum]
MADQAFNERSSTTMTTPTEATDQGGKTRGSWGLPLRLAIIALVVFNIATVSIAVIVISYSSSLSSNRDAITQGTANIITLVKGRQSDSSNQVTMFLESQLDKVDAVINATNTQILQRKVNVTDFDAMAPMMISNLRAIRPTIMFHLIFNNRTNEVIGTGSIYENFSSPDPTQYIYMYLIQKNKTCARFCPSVTTNGSVHLYFVSEDDRDSLSIGGMQTKTAPNIQFWKRAWYQDVYNLPVFSLHYTDATIGLTTSAFPRLIIQYAAFPVFDADGNSVAAGFVAMSLFNFAKMLDQVKTRATKNSVFYIMAPTGQVLGMSGLNQTSYYQQSPLIHQISDGSYTVKTIWDFPYADYPLVNVSASNILKYSGNDLYSDFADTQFQDGEYFYQVTSYRRKNYKWIIVSGAPANDYLSDTLVLQSRLAVQLNDTNRNVIIIAVSIVVAMVLVS